MDDHYSPHTGEYVPAGDDVPEWLARAGTPRPDYDPATQSLFWRDGYWERVELAPIRQARRADDERGARDQKLAALDALVMNPLRWAAYTPAQQADLAVYRQALLDVPQQPGFPGEIVWPDTPAPLAG